MGYTPSLCLAALLFLNIVTTNGLPATTVQTTDSMDLPSPLLPMGPAAVHHAVTSDGDYVNVQLTQPFYYFGRQYSNIYMSMDGFLSFTPLNYDRYVQLSNTDIIAPLWTDIDVYTRGDISYEQATDGPLLDAVSSEMMDPGFFATWVFVGTWDSVEFEPDTGAVTFQVVLVSDSNGRTFILMNYGPIPNNTESWVAGYQTQEDNNVLIPVPNISDLSTSTNIGIPGRWAFQVDSPFFVTTTEPPTTTDETTDWTVTTTELPTTTDETTDWTVTTTELPTTTDETTDWTVSTTELPTTTDETTDWTDTTTDTTTLAQFPHFTTTTPNPFTTTPFWGNTGLIPMGPAAVHHAVTSDGDSVNVQLTQPFHYFGRQYSNIYMSMDGFLSFTSLYFDSYVQFNNIDIIAPLWTDIDVYTRGDISYEQATNGPLLDAVSSEMNRMYPGFFATWVFVGTWDSVEFEPDTGAVTFQVVLVSDSNGHTFILMNYGPIPNNPESWVAGYQTQENNNYFISVPNISDLSASTNVGIPGRFAFQVDGPHYVPSTLFPVLSSAIRPPFYDGGYTQVQLSHPFTYFGKEYTSLFFNMDGVITFESQFLDDYVPNLNVDAIAPLWSDIDTYTRGLIKYEQATDGPLLKQASHEINRAFPGSNFNASWVFVGTWLKVEFEPDTGEVTFQVVLIADDEGHSFVLMNYGPLPSDPEPWMAGYQTKDNTHQYIIHTASTSDLTTSTNVGIPGRWAFRVNDPFQLFFPIPPSAVHHAVTGDGSYAEIQLSHTFSYFGKDHEKLYLSMDGFLSFEHLFFDGYVPNVNKDIIAPLWTDIDAYTRGDISYTQATNGTLLKQASDEINRMFPGSRFTASWVFVATWEKMEFEPDTGEVTFQVALVSDIDSDVSFIIMNYGSIPDDPESWMAGYQTEDNKHQYHIQAPSTSQLSKTSNVGIPGRWAFRVDACSALNCTAREECKARSGIYGCACANNNPRFNAATFDAYNFCNSSSGMLSLSRCELFEAGFPSDFLHLNDPSCGGVIQDDRVVFTFDNRFRICGTTMQSNATHFVYENAVRMAGGVSSGNVISRDSWLDMKFSCVYPLIQSISMSMSIHASGSVVSKLLPGTESAYQLRLVTYPDSSFSTPYSGDMTLEVNQQVFIAVEADGIDSSQFATVLDSCWATPYNDINYPVRWDLIINECPNDKDGTVEVLQNGVWTASHFSFRMFTFTGISNNIFLHCQVHLCPRMSGQCSQPCNDNDDDDQFRGRRRRSVDFHDKASVSMSF